MRITTEMRALANTQGIKGIYKICDEELSSRTLALKKAKDMNTVSRHQGAIEVLETLLKLESS